MRRISMIGLLATLPLVGCSSDKDDDGHDTGHVDTGDTESDTDTDTDTDTDSDTDVDVPDTYEFDSALSPGESSVSYSGQVFRQLLMADMKAALEVLTGMVDANTGMYANPGTIKDYLWGVYWTGELLDGSRPHLLSFSTDALQTTYDEVSSGKDLQGKIAGNDSATDYKNWTGGDFAGWNAPSPEALVEAWLDMLDANVVAYAKGGDLTGIDGSAVSKVYFTSEGHDLQQLIQKFSGVAIAFHQAADDYTDDDVDGKGLNADHIEPYKGTNPYTALEHAWDEAFGYFGAARAYGQWDDSENKAASKGYDADGDGKIDLKTEVNWGHSVNCAKRDLGAVAATDFTGDAWAGFTLGRQLLAETAGTALTEAQLNELKGHRDQAIGAWEKAIAATAVHYVNDTLQALKAATLDAEELATVWSELKGFALAFQFNPRSPMSDADFVKLHNLLGEAPSLDASYEADLIEARALMGTAYSFDSTNMGDANGENGW